ncbi:MAG TPA: thioredoxin domain-containing protein [Thermoleophilaceae bacterium]|jgi:protein-disulfide isomerase|nr:thioredoxin domain-containing protein [Thermoleophilaceae bacterium]
MANTTKAERKQQARGERLAREQAQAEAERRRTRLIRVGAVLLLAVIAVAGAIALSSGSGGTTATVTSRQTAGTVDRLLAGIPQTGNTLGKKSAPVTVTLYEDLQCPICREFTLGAENQLIANDVRAGRVKLVFRSLQTATPDPTTFQVQQQAAAAAGKQQKLWNFVELFYHQQGQEGTAYVTESYLDKLARQVTGLNHARWLADRNAGLGSTVSADEALAKRSGFNSTPTIAVQGPKSSPQPVAGAASYSELEQLVKQAGG